LHCPNRYFLHWLRIWSDRCHRCVGDSPGHRRPHCCLAPFVNNPWIRCCLGYPSTLHSKDHDYCWHKCLWSLHDRLRFVSFTQIVPPLLLTVILPVGVDMKFLNPPILSQLLPHMLSGQGLTINWDNVQNKAFPYLLLGGLVVFAVGTLYFYVILCSLKELISTISWHNCTILLYRQRI